MSTLSDQLFILIIHIIHTYSRCIQKALELSLRPREEFAPCDHSDVCQTSWGVRWRKRRWATQHITTWPREISGGFQAIWTKICLVNHLNTHGKRIQSTRISYRNGMWPTVVSSTVKRPSSKYSLVAWACGNWCPSNHWEWDPCQQREKIPIYTKTTAKIRVYIYIIQIYSYICIW